MPRCDVCGRWFRSYRGLNVHRARPHSLLHSMEIILGNQPGKRRRGARGLLPPLPPPPDIDLLGGKPRRKRSRRRKSIFDLW